MVNAEPRPTEWFYQLLGLPTGPVSVERIQWLIQQQHLTADSLVGCSMNGPWVPLADSGLRQLLPHTNPAVSVAAPTTTTAGDIPKKKPRRSRPTSVPVSIGIEIDTDALVGRDETETPAPIELDAVDVVATDPSKSFRTESAPVSTEPPTPNESLRVMEPVVVPFQPPETQVASVTDPELQITQPEPVATPVRPGPMRSRKADRTETQADASRHLKQAKRSKSSSAGPATAPGSRLTSVVDGVRRRPTLAIGAGVVSFLALAFCFGLFSSRVDTEEAAATFERVMSEFDSNSNVGDIEWAKWCAARRDEVSAVLEPLREHASADRPDIQNLMWAGDRLMLLLKGVRKVPPSVRTRFESYMAEYRGDPPPVSSAAEPGDRKSQQVIDPIF